MLDLLAGALRLELDERLELALVLSDPDVYLSEPCAALSTEKDHELVVPDPGGGKTPPL